VEKIDEQLNLIYKYKDTIKYNNNLILNRKEKIIKELKK
jgi:hypothetical protein